MRVQIPAYTDRWMMGDRYGDVVKVIKRTINNVVREIAYVRLDKSGKVRKFILDDCTIV